MTRRLDDLDDTPLHDDDPDRAPVDDAEEDARRLAELLSDRGAQAGTVRVLESLEEQLRERGWLSAKQRALIGGIEERRDRSRSGRF